MGYQLARLAPGSYDVLLDGEIIASLISNGAIHHPTWTAELLAEGPAGHRPAPFTALVHTFTSFKEARRWLERDEPRPGGSEDPIPAAESMQRDSTPSDPSSMRQRLPYAKWTFADGLEVLVNREYEPIGHRLPGQPAKGSPLSPLELGGTKTGEMWFYSDATAPWLDEQSRARCEQALELFLS